MKIGQVGEGLQPDLVSRTAGQAGGGNGPVKQAAPVAATDRVELSDASRQLTAGDASINLDKVAEVRKAISEGSFRIDPSVVADKMISEAAELIERIAHGAR